MTSNPSSNLNITSSASSSWLRPSINSHNSSLHTLMILLSNICNLVSVKLDHSNYMLWKFQITSTLSAYSFLDIVDGSYPCSHVLRNSLEMKKVLLPHKRLCFDVYDSCYTISICTYSCCCWANYS